jgi:hypothetical protein
MLLKPYINNVGLFCCTSLLRREKQNHYVIASRRRRCRNLIVGVSNDEIAIPYVRDSLQQLTKLIYQLCIPRNGAFTLVYDERKLNLPSVTNVKYCEFACIITNYS